jgi:hypothetical protein
MRAAVAVMGGLICLMSTSELLGQSPEGERRYFVRGLGRDTCVAWTGTHRHRDRERLLAYTSWLDGYVSAWNSVLARDRPDLRADVTNVETTALEAWIDAHCRSSPYDTLERAAFSFVLDRVGSLNLPATEVPQETWVAWRRTDVAGARTDWSVLVAVKTLDTCREVAQHDAARTFQDLQNGRDVQGVVPSAVSYDGATIAMQFADGRRGTLSNTCFPATVDPRPR